MDNKAVLIVACLAPAILLLVVFLAYPLGLGVWLAFTDTQIGGGGHFVGLENFASLANDSVFWLTVFQTIFYTFVATAGKFALGLWLALLLNHNIPFSSIIRAVILLPWIVPTVLSAITFWWIYDPQFSIISYLLVDKLHWLSSYIDFLGRPGTPASPSSSPISGEASRSWRSACWPACRRSPRRSMRRRCWMARRPGSDSASSRRPCLCPSSRSCSPSPCYSPSATSSSSTRSRAAVRLTRRSSWRTLAFQRGIPGGQLGEGAAIAVAMIPFLVASTMFSYFALSRRKWQQGEANE